MNDPLQKYAKMVDTLLEKSKLGKVPWEANGNSSISVESTNALLRITISTDENYENVYTFDLYDVHGSHVDGFNDVTLSGLVASPNYFARMDQLYHLGRRQAIGADKLLDGFMDDLESDKLGVAF